MNRRPKPDPYSIATIKKWVDDHPRAASYVSFEIADNDHDKLSIFSANLSKYIEHLELQRTYLSKSQQEIINRIDEITQQPFMNVGNIFSDDPNDDMLLRKCVFVYRTIQQKELTLCNLKNSLHQDKIEDTIYLLELLKSGNIVPVGVTCKIDASFNMMNYTEKIVFLENHISKLKAYFDKIKQEITVMKKADWFTDFNGFFKETMGKSRQHLDETLAYVPPLPCELSISRSLFSCENPNGQKIDNLINKLCDIPPNEFIHKVLDLSIELLPNPDDLSPEEQSVGMLVFFRIIFDRLYELYPSFMFTVNKAAYVKMAELAALPCTAFKLPEDSSPTLDSSVTVRDLFRGDSYYRSASMFLDGSMYCTNPIDSLFAIHKTLLSINKAALMQRITRKKAEASLDDIQQLLCFDDLFVLFLGVYLASDNSEFISVAEFVMRFSPAFCLSNSFEYAQASLESLVKHINTLNVDEIRARM